MTDLASVIGFIDKSPFLKQDIHHFKVSYLARLVERKIALCYVSREREGDKENHCQ